MGYIIINDAPVTATPGEWWLDKAFGVYGIGKNVKIGKNKVTLKSAPFTVFTELESVYIRGDFALEPVTQGFEIRPVRPLSLQSWKGQGLPLYPDGVSYTHQVSVTLSRDEQYQVKLPQWQGSFVEVVINGKVVDTPLAPYETDITRFLQEGANTIAVVVYGTLKNTLGPYHQNPPLGSAWPYLFMQGAKGGFPPGNQYSTLDYGLWEDFQVIQLQ